MHPEQSSHLVLVSGAGVSAAAQMRYGCAEHLRRCGFVATDLADFARLREAFEAHQRGALDRHDAQAVVDAYASRPWFELFYVPRRIADRPGGWQNMDYDAAGPDYTRTLVQWLLEQITAPKDDG